MESGSMPCDMDALEEGVTLPPHTTHGVPRIALFDEVLHGHFESPRTSVLHGHFESPRSSVRPHSGREVVPTIQVTGVDLGRRQVSKAESRAASPGRQASKDTTRVTRGALDSQESGRRQTHELDAFANSAHLALDAVRRSLVVEHERAQAALKLEIAQLRGELHLLHAQAKADEVAEGEPETSMSVDGIVMHTLSESCSPSDLRIRDSGGTASQHTLGSDWKMAWKRNADNLVCKAGSEFNRDNVSKTGSVDYSHLGLCMRLRMDKQFLVRVVESTMGLVIVLNTLTLGLSSEFHSEWFGWVWVDMVFAGLFTAELVIKLTMLGWKSYMCGQDWRWNDFEMLLVGLAWVEVGFSISKEHLLGFANNKSSLFRMLRLMRLAKLVRILRLQVFCELLMMVNGAVGSVKTLLYSMVLIFIPLYGVAMILKETLGVQEEKGHGAEKFNTLGLAFFTLYRCFVTGDCSQEDGRPIFVMVAENHGWFYGALYCLFSFLMTFGLFNVIVAIYVENTVSAAKFNDLFVKRQRLRDREYFEEKAQVLLKMIWTSHFDHLGRAKEEESEFNIEAAGKLKLTQEFFEELCQQDTFTDVLRDLDISEDDQRDLFETLDVEGTGTIDLLEFVIGIGKLRGEARKADVISVGLILRSLQHKILQLEAKLGVARRRESIVAGGEIMMGRTSSVMGRNSSMMGRTSSHY